MNKFYRFSSALAVGIFAASTALAASPIFSNGQIIVEPDEKAVNLTLTVSGPAGYYEFARSKGGSVAVELLKPGKLVDGLYRWQLTGNTEEQMQLYPQKENNGRDIDDRRFTFKTIDQSGTFRVYRGKRVEEEEEPVTKKATKEDRVEE